MMKKLKENWYYIWLIASILAFLYFLGLVAFTGTHNVFYMMWGPIALCFFAMFWIAKKHWIKKYIPQWAQIVGGIIIGIGLLFFMTVEVMILTGFGAKPSGDVDAMIVLGAYVHNGQPSNVCKRRLDAALAYYNEHEDVIVVVTGAKGKAETTSEAYAMGQYLEKHGVPSDQILLEEKATDTSENLKYSYEVLEKYYGACDDLSIAVVTNDFHVFRATFLAKRVGFVNPQAIAARDDWKVFTANIVREFFGVVKDGMGI